MDVRKPLITEFKEPDYGLLPNTPPVPVPPAHLEGSNAFVTFRQLVARAQHVRNDVSVLQDPVTYVAYFLASHTRIRPGDAESIYPLYDEFRAFVPDVPTIPNIKRAAFTSILTSWAHENHLRCYVKDGDVIAVDGLGRRAVALTPGETAAFVEGWSCQHIVPAPIAPTWTYESLFDDR